MSKLLILIPLVALLNTACTIFGDNNEESATRSIFLQIGAKTTSQSDTPIAGDVTASEINDLNLFFLNDTGLIIQSKAITSSTTPSIKQLQEGYKFEDIRSSVVQAYIIANNTTNNGSDDIAKLIHKRNIEELERDIASQNPAPPSDTTTVPYASWRYVTMSGSGMIKKSDGESGASAVTVDIAPLVARIEIAKISADPSSIRSFVLKGIFINNHYRSFVLAPTDIARGDITNYKSSSMYVEANFKGLCDVGNPLAAEVAGKCYGYQVIPSIGTDAESAVAMLPHIIVEVGSVVLADGTLLLPDRQYVTIRSFKSVSTGTPALLEMRNNNVYKIRDIHFGLNNLAIEPEMVEQLVTVKVSVEPWTVKNIDEEI